MAQNLTFNDGLNKVESTRSEHRIKNMLFSLLFSCYLMLLCEGTRIIDEKLIFSKDVKASKIRQTER